MVETYHIVLGEKDPLVADEIRRYLGAGLDRAAFVVESHHGLVELTQALKSKHQDLLLLDSTMAVSSPELSTLQNTLAQKKIPLVILSTTNGNELVEKAANTGAVDYLQKNKLNYYHLPRLISTAINRSKDVGNNEIAALPTLLNTIAQAVLLIAESGDIRYANIAAKKLLTLPETLALVKLYTNSDSLAIPHRASVQLHATTYHLVVDKLNWAGELCTSICIRQEANTHTQLLEDRMKLLRAMISDCQMPFAVFINDALDSVNGAFRQLMDLQESDVTGLSLSQLIGVAVPAQSNIYQPNGSITIDSIHSRALTSPLSVLLKEFHEDTYHITICSLVPASGNSTSLFNAHRLMEIASHDLREPVRTTLSYLKLLHDGLKKEGNEKLLGYTDTILDEMNRAERMLTDMKTLMNLSEKAPKLVTVKILSIVQEVLKQLKPIIDSTDAMVNVSDLPELKADPEEMKRLLHHLIDNALKFQKDKKRPYVEILGRKDGKFWQLCVKDNGIGIDKKYQEVIFEPFKKLNRVDQYSGAGNGLAICRHIVSQHGGRLWVESSEGFGSSFFFTIPM